MKKVIWSACSLFPRLKANVHVRLMLRGEDAMSVELVFMDSVWQMLMAVFLVTVTLLELKVAVCHVIRQLASAVVKLM